MQQRLTIVVFHRDRLFREVIAAGLAIEEGCQCVSVDHEQDDVDGILAREEPDVILLDSGLPQDFVSKWKASTPSTGNGESGVIDWADEDSSLEELREKIQKLKPPYATLVLRRSTAVRREGVLGRAESAK